MLDIFRPWAFISHAVELNFGNVLIGMFTVFQITMQKKKNTMEWNCLFMIYVPTFKAHYFILHVSISSSFPGGPKLVQCMYDTTLPSSCAMVGTNSTIYDLGRNVWSREFVSFRVLKGGALAAIAAPELFWIHIRRIFKLPVVSRVMSSVLRHLNCLVYICCVNEKWTERFFWVIIFINGIVVMWLFELASCSSASFSPGMSNKYTTGPHF